MRTVTSLEPLGEGCILAYGSEFDAPATTVWLKAEQDAWRAHATDYLERVRRVLQADATL